MRLLKKYIKTLIEAQYSGPGVQQSISYGKNYHTVNPKPNTWENYPGLEYDISGDGNYFYANIKIKDAPHIEIPTRKFKDEESAEWWVRSNYEKIHRLLMSKT